MVLNAKKYAFINQFPMTAYRWVNDIEAETKPVGELVDVIFSSFMASVNSDDLKRLREDQTHICCAVIDDKIIAYVRENSELKVLEHVEPDEVGLVMLRQGDSVVLGVPREALEGKQTIARLIAKTDEKQPSVEG
jgi:hypothetical protein